MFEAGAEEEGSGVKLWTTLEERKLRELFPVYKTKDVAKMMSRSYRSVRDKAYDLGLKKEFDFIDTFLPGHKIHPFKKGEWAPGCEKTWFQKGNRMHSFPIGTERIRWGVVFIKVTDTPTPKGLDNRQGFLLNWKRKKNLVWEEHFGPVPDGHFVCVKDGNQHNCSPKNLALVDRNNLAKYANRDRQKWSEAKRKDWANRKAGKGEAHTTGPSALTQSQSAR